MKLGAAAVAVVMLAAGCGGGGGSKTVAPPAWAAGVCRQIAAWQDRTGALAADLPAQVQKLNDDLPAAREQVADSVDKMVEATDRMIGGVEDTGTPNTAQGATIAERFRTGLQEAKGVLTKARAKADDLSVDNPATFENGVDDIGTDLQAAGDRIAQARSAIEDDFDAPDLDAAFENEPDCQRVAMPGDVRPSDWAGGVCGTILSWEDELKKLATDLQTQIRGVGRDLTAARARLVDFMVQVVASTDRLLAGVEAAGAPAVQKGEQIASDFREGLVHVRQVFEEARVTAENLAVDDPKAFTAGADELSRKIRDAGDRIRQQFQELDSAYDVPELDRAFAAAPACRQVRS